MKADYMLIKLNFSNELAISPDLDQDLVVFHIKEQRELFISETLLQDLSDNFTTLMQKVPKQMTDSTVTDILIGTAKTVEIFIKGSFIGSFLFYVVLSQVFALLLGMINSLQIVIHLPILYVVMPGNVQ